MKLVQYFLVGIGTITLALLIATFILLDFAPEKPKKLAAYPNAEWRGGPDGGEYYEVTQASPPYFYVQIRSETGRLWKEGWFKLNVETKEQALNSIAGFDGDEEIYLSISTEILTRLPKQNPAGLSTQ
ncbi:hypothetical protein [Metapseudomonas otitidis]|uniref:hypothetical protein n=1 Tax=Metapseudomonas otitidis TaxID=319939 RepID=UPI0025418FF1|nr:hypothetical protein [Pseudomonas otitidis]WIF68067.1 hypothetical protein QN096_02710 [Pseudomonas otitidis]